MNRVVVAVDLLRRRVEKMPAIRQEPGEAMGDFAGAELGHGAHRAAALGNAQDRAAAGGCEQNHAAAAPILNPRSSSRKCRKARPESAISSSPATLHATQLNRDVGAAFAATSGSFPTF